MLIWLKVILIGLTAIAGITAAHSKRKGLLASIAVVCALLAITIELASTYTQNEIEQQRAADLKYIQTLNFPVVRVGFDLTLQPVPEDQSLRLIWFCQYQKEQYRHIAGEGYSGVMALRLTGASYVSISNAYNHDVELDTSISNHIILWINDFGIKRSKGKMVWEPKTIGDLSGVIISMGIGRDPPPPGPFAERFESPVKKVEIYVNSINPSSRIASTTLKYEERWFHYSFLPTGISPFVVESYASFYLNPFELRKGILDSIRGN